MATSSLSNHTILITGGSGSFGKSFTKFLLKKYPKITIRIYSRDEFKQWQMAEEFKPHLDRLRFLIGDVRDLPRLKRAFSDVDLVIHAAALKQVPACEYNPFEAVKTNILGSQNVIEAAIDCKVPKVFALITDKAVSPINLYGATKLCSEKLFIQGNSYAGAEGTRFSAARWGNIVGSRGSIIPKFIQQSASGVLTITDPRMTRFWITLDQVQKLVDTWIQKMQGGEVFIPKCPSAKIVDIASQVAPQAKQKIIGIRPGEKLHEELFMEHESHRALEFDKYYLIKPEFNLWSDNQGWKSGKPVTVGYRYSSDTNPQWLTKTQINQLIALCKK